MLLQESIKKSKLFKLVKDMLVTVNLFVLLKYSVEIVQNKSKKQKTTPIKTVSIYLFKKNANFFYWRMLPFCIEFWMDYNNFAVGFFGFCIYFF